MRLHNTESGRRRHSAPPMAEINIIPLVDVVLVLLIIFMATTAFVKEAGLDMTLPTASTANAKPEESKDLTIALTREGGIYLDGKPSSEAGVQAAMMAKAKSNPQTLVIVKADQRLEYRRIVRMIDMARQARLPNFTLATIEESEPVSAATPQPAANQKPQTLPAR